MRLLLDTHAVIWWLIDDARLGRQARNAFVSSEHKVMFSVVSAFEMTIKHRIGKLPEVTELLDDLSAYLAAQSFEVLALTLEHAELAGRLQIPHKDPFDRLLIAQARIEDARLVSNEIIFDRFGVRRLW